MVIKELSYQGRAYFNITKETAKNFGISDAAVNDAIDNQRINDLVDSRRRAYMLESDPLFLEWQYDQTPEKEQAWRDKVAEIKARYSLPE